MAMDSVILSGLVSLSCGNMQDVNNAKSACSTGIEAFTRQSGIYENVKDQEKIYSTIIENTVKQKLNKKTIDVMSTIAISGSLLLGQRNSFELGEGFLGEKYTFETNLREFQIKIGWDL